ncbi:MAG: protein phosphatase 2C domain-containing protein [Desulfovibrio sp.]|uniref:protein phosphatase 2C domain-containing protein n=1 Tax=Desulfovibrio sp. TaxID=885 RepID=UPI0025901E3A|nr:protein phosphatase 2C domain-containing protein [Desulfovibrio sp.]MCD7983445.1 protein phosphatase 2C domain-containing protein [Desulfovibrio sp.]
MIQYKSYSFSLPKKSAISNQDSILSPTEIGDYVVFAIADGVGGAANGDKASSFITRYCSNLMKKSPDISLKALFENLWISFVSYAKRNGYNEMASTLTFCRVGRNKLEIAHVGDCRVYVKQEKRSIKQVTQDHTAIKDIKVKYNDEIEKYYSNLITSSFSIYEK